MFLSVRNTCLHVFAINLCITNMFTVYNFNLYALIFPKFIQSLLFFTYQTKVCVRVLGKFLEFFCGSFFAAGIYIYNPEFWVIFDADYTFYHKRRENPPNLTETTTRKNQLVSQSVRLGRVER